MRSAPLGELTAVFHAASGETHLVGGASVAILERLGRGPADRTALAAVCDWPAGRLDAELAGLVDVGLITEL